MKSYKIGSAVAFALASAAAIEAVVNASRSIITIALGEAATLSLSDDAKPQIGDEVILKVSSDGTARDLTFGTGFTAPVLAGVINKTKTQSFVYDGSAFIATGAPVQID